MSAVLFSHESHEGNFPGGLGQRFYTQVKQIYGCIIKCYESAGWFIGHGSEANHTLDIKNRTNIN